MSRLSSTFKTVTTKSKVKESSIVPNAAGGPGYTRPDEEAYLQMLMTNVLGNTFYQSRERQIMDSLSMHEAAVVGFPEFMAKAAVYARNKGYMRTQPAMAMAFLAREKSPFFPVYFEQAVLTPSDLFDFMGFYIYLTKNSFGGRWFKRAVGNWLARKLNPFWVVKYGGVRDGKYNLRNIMIGTHPKGINAELSEYIIRGTTPESEEMAVIKEFEALKNAKNEDEACAIAKRGKLPHEVVSTFTDRYPALWSAIAGHMPIQALMMSLTSLAKKGALSDADNIAYVKSVFSSKERVEKSKLLPFQLINAYDAVLGSGCEDWVLDALRDAVDLSVQNIPDNMSKTVVALDVSGSMRGNYLRIGSVIGMALARKSTGCTFYTFGSDLKKERVSERDSILTQAEAIRTRGNTSTNLPVEAMIADYRQSGKVADTLILITDDEQNNGRPFYDAVKEYRDIANKNLKLFLVDIGSYTSSGKSIPESKNNWTLVGWSPKVLDFMLLAIEGYGSMVEYINSK